ncbi:hypothetical protein [Streptomyces zagrosensis]|uniref:Uncharacterized protein n=1 Tax=Streptomyces zagrosensis TaxID=1042984 RepID=A0A7W9UWS7_9ACTN|nr:hypothetical protein [Streptomyces zagrosensis]MBB5934245.1 hypothetical protein [Streptomyces zagrosensis]
MVLLRMEFVSRGWVVLDGLVRVEVARRLPTTDGRQRQRWLAQQRLRSTRYVSNGWVSNGWVSND